MEAVVTTRWSKRPPADQHRGGLVAQLRGETGSRPAVDPGLAGGLRSWLQDELIGCAKSGEDGARPLVITPGFLSTASVHGDLLHRTALRRIVSALFRQWLVIGSVDDPVADAISALSVAGDCDASDVVEHVRSLDPTSRHELDRYLRRRMSHIARDWPVPSPVWMPRVSEFMAVPVSGDDVVLSGSADLVLGDPATDRSSICLVLVESDGEELEASLTRKFFALLETLRSGAQPFRVASYFASTGVMRVDEVDAAFLGSSVAMLAESVRCLIN